MKYLLVVLALFTAGCATTPMTEQQAMQSYRQRQEQRRIAAIPKCGPAPTSEQYPSKVDLDFAKIMYSTCANNDLTVNSVPIGGPIGAETIVVDYR